MARFRENIHAFILNQFYCLIKLENAFYNMLLFTITDFIQGCFVWTLGGGVEPNRSARDSESCRRPPHATLTGQLRQVNLGRASLYFRGDNTEKLRSIADIYNF